MKDHFTMSPKMKTKEKKSSLGGWRGLQHATFKGAFIHTLSVKDSGVESPNTKLVI
jgi:hypothetical protein